MLWIENNTSAPKDYHNPQCPQSWSFSSRGRGFHPASYTARENHTGPPSTSCKPTNKSNANEARDPPRVDRCQICGKKGHVALKCWNKFNHSYKLSGLPQALAAIHWKIPLLITNGLQLLEHLPI